MKRWCLHQSEWCVCSAHLRWCKCTGLSAPQCLACEAEETRWTAEAALGPAQHDPPRHWGHAWFLCHISEWPQAHWMTWRSKSVRNSAAREELCREWTEHHPLPVLYSLKDNIFLSFHSDWCGIKPVMTVKPGCTLLFPRRSPHLGLISWYKRAKVGRVRAVTQNPQSALHSEQTLVVHCCDGWIEQSSLSRGGICGPGDLGCRVGVVGGAGEGLLSHLHHHWLDGSWRDSTNDLPALVSNF